MVPDCYLADLDEGVIVFENLKLSGFDIRDKAKGMLDYAVVFCTYDFSQVCFKKVSTWRRP